MTTVAFIIIIIVSYLAVGFFTLVLSLILNDIQESQRNDFYGKNSGRYRVIDMTMVIIFWPLIILLTLILSSEPD